MGTPKMGLPPPPTVLQLEPFDDQWGLSAPGHAEQSSTDEDDDSEKVAFLLHQADSHRENSVTAIADSGASHVLIRHADDHVLTNREYTTPGALPYATLIAANGATLKAIGRGTLEVGTNFKLSAYIFASEELTSNLLGIIPFCDQGHAAIFTKRTLQLVHQPTEQVIMTGHRSHAKALWKVTLKLPPQDRDPGARIADDQGEPQLHRTRSPAIAGGEYVEANYLRTHNAASYVRFVHAAMGYPCPTTFLHAVTAKYITGKDQYPRLTPQMVRRHMPNALAAARGHLDRTHAAAPHGNSEAVSARKRHHRRLQTERDQATRGRAK
jgi:hypothetical protein